jgi:hypothetical protein
MSTTWRAKASEMFRTWRSARFRRRQQADAVRGRREAEQLERARKGVEHGPGGL